MLMLRTVVSSFVSLARFVVFVFAVGAFHRDKRQLLHTWQASI